MPRSFLILHGVNGSGVDHWQTHLAHRLRRRGEVVLYPELSSKEDPDCDVWLAELDQQLRMVPNLGELTVVCHSLSCILWMHYAADAVPPVERLILVAPPGPVILQEFRPTFFPIPVDEQRLKVSAGEILLVCTNADPRCPEKAAVCYGEEFRLQTVLLPDEAEHINIASGFGDWPEMSASCLTTGFPEALLGQLAATWTARRQ